jgi:hypothetical protein
MKQPLGWRAYCLVDMRRPAACRLPPELNAAFVAIDGERPDALLVGSDPFLVNRREELVALAACLGIPTAYSQRDYVAAGGFDELRAEHCERLPAGWHLRRPHSQGREACGPSGHSARHIRVGDQFKTAKTLASPFPMRCNYWPTR